MRFRREPTPPPRGLPPDRHRRAMLLAAIALVMLACLRPWSWVSFAVLLPDVLGPVGWRTPAGFTCMLCHLLVAMLTLLDPGHARAAVRDASLLLVSAAALVLAHRWLLGPGELRGLEASWTLAFYATASFVLVALWLSAGQLRSRRA